MDPFLLHFHFLRPTWFFGFIPLLILSLLLIRSHTHSKSWQSIIDPKLLPHLLVGKSIKHSALPSTVYFIIGTLIIISLAGPAWEKRPQPVFKEQSALVIALDLSRSMDAGDIKPSRLTRARLKITDILNQRKLGQTALIVYAADAYTVSPLTDDTATITALLPSLTTSLMPAQGTRTDKALKQAVSLFNNSGITHGDILLVTDGIEPDATATFEKVSQDHRISILAVATTEGAPIPQESGGFVKDRSGNIVVPKLNSKRFQELINHSRGKFSLISNDDSDIKSITSLFDTNRFEAKKESKTSTLQTDSWYEQGPWLLFLVIPVVALAFRRGLLFVLLIVILQQPQQAQADSLWDSLWTNSDQRAAKLLEKQKPAEAAQLFNNQQWKAASHYKSKQYQKTIDELQDINTADGHYNKGNAYAQLGQNKKAIEEYTAAIKLDPKHKDAIFNKALLEKNKDQDKKKKNSSSSDKNKKQSKDQKKSNQDKQPSKQGKPDKDSKGKSNSQHDDKNQGQGQSNPNPNPNTKNPDNKKQADNQQQSDKDSNKNAATPEQTRKKESTNKDQAQQNKGQQQESKNNPESDKNAAAAQTEAADAEQKKNQKLTQQWLRRIPDDPGGLLRNKFKYQYKRQQHSSEENNW